MNMDIRENINKEYKSYNKINTYYKQWFYYSINEEYDIGLCYVTEKGIFSVDVAGINLIEEKIWKDYRFRPFKGEITIKVN